MAVLDGSTVHAVGCACGFCKAGWTRAVNYTAYCDGACRISNPGLCCAGFVIYLNDVEVHRSARVLPGLNTNNHAEYQGMIDCLEWAAEFGDAVLTIYCDSKLVVEQSQGRWNVKPELRPYAARVMQLLRDGNHSLFHVTGHSGNVGNEAVDLFLNETLDKFQGKPPKKRKI